jgi:predicted metal-binding protein
MSEPVRIGIIICDRYRTCAGGKCLRALRNREGAFSRYRGQEAELVGYTSCSGCPGGNIESAPEEMQKNGATVVHLATGLIVGYPPCPYLAHFKAFIEKKFTRSRRSTSGPTWNWAPGKRKNGRRSSIPRCATSPHGWRTTERARRSRVRLTPSAPPIRHRKA